MPTPTLTKPTPRLKPRPRHHVRYGDPEAIADPGAFPPCDECGGDGHAGGARTNDCSRCRGTGIDPDGGE